jgi:aminopeptidase
MTDPRIEKLADVIVHYSAAIRCGDRVLIQGMTIAEPLIREIYSAVLNAGGHPLVLAQLPGLNSLFIRHASPAQLE